MLPGAAQEKPQEGKVLSVGNGKLLPDGSRSVLQIREGDRVLFPAMLAQKLKLTVVRF